MFSCSPEQHNKCENSALCHLCDGIRLYKNSYEERLQKQKAREERKAAEKRADFRIHKAEKKEGMSFEKDVTKAWNSGYHAKQKQSDAFKQSSKKTKIQKPRIQLDESESVKEDKVPEAAPPKTVSLSTFTKTAAKEKPVVDAKRQSNSGALWYAKGDIKTQDYLMECKERGTVNARGEKTISIPKDWLTKQEKEAFQENRPFWILPFRYKNDDSIYLVKSFDQEIEMYQEIRRLREELEQMRSQAK
ncbi:hypothetical protein [Cytobacillus oceanisediminis]|uniref:hypothetical protein n=1 Tax=Cytobacillus oceanisediminis TaxID=665099 RepID=UPI001FB4237F|nr:hypothetical protein [Cytobacillus oceanisediminis]UOE58188.1 hypothetical protein IRB79_27175 [Cytobacillus oceanisediminis]